jgi:hypothetical protein
MLSLTAITLNWHCANVADQQTWLLTVWERSADTCIPSQVTILCHRRRFLYVYHNYSQELTSKAIFGFSTSNWRGINCFGYGYIAVLTHVSLPKYLFYAKSHNSCTCIMTARAKNGLLRPYLDSAHRIEEESTILVTDTFCVLTSVIVACSVPFVWLAYCMEYRKIVLSKKHVFLSL